jgi:hypothetical protein
MVSAGPRRTLLPLLILACGSNASLLQVDFGEPWKPPAGAPPNDTAITAVWSRQNIWLPWKRWDSSKPPRFEPFVRELALVMPLGARPDGEFSVPELYRDSAGSIAAFDPRHPFFEALAILKAQGIRPVILIGPVPAALCIAGATNPAGHPVPGATPIPGPFGWVVDAPVDYEKYYRYIRSLFSYLISPGMYGSSEVDSWRFHLHSEPDNYQSWNPMHTAVIADSGNLAAYQRLYDCTLAGMRDAGVHAPLALGNLMIPEAGVMGAKSSWTEPLLAWLASGTDNRCPEHLRLPRLRPKQDTLDISFSAYGGDDGQMGYDPRNLGPLLARFRAAAARHFPGNPVRISIGEGNLIAGRLLHRSEGSELGAAWNASIFKIALDAGVHRYQQWGFVSAPHISVFMERGGLPSAAYNVIELLRRMEGQGRRAIRIGGAPLARDSAVVDALAAEGPDGTLRVLAFHYRYGHRPAPGSGATLHLRGLEPGRKYAVRQYRIDRDHANYIPMFEKDLKARGLSIETRDACMEYQFGPQQKAVWDANKEAYRARSRLEPYTGKGPSSVKASLQGRAGIRISLPPNSVILLELSR